MPCAFFKAQRTTAGEELVLRKNLFIEYLLPLRGISQDAMEVYRSYFRIRGPSRLPMLTWTRDLPIEGEPKDVVEIVDSYAHWCQAVQSQSCSSMPNLLSEAMRKSWKR